MSELVLNVDLRENTGTGGARATRREGLVPAVIYGGDQGSVAISLKLNELKKALRRGGFRSQMIKIDHKGDLQPVIVREIQFHPVTSVPMHLDLYRVEEGQIISVEVSVEFINEEESPGLKRGGALNIVRHTVELDCPAGSIPEKVTVDLTGLEIGDSLHISAVTLPDNVTPTIKDRDFTIATISGSGPAAVEETEGEGEDEKPPETEVIGKGKDADAEE